MNYDTLSEAISDLQEKGYTENLYFKQDSLECKALNYNLYAKDFEVDHLYRFEGDSDPDDASILYAISAPKFNFKGLLVDAYGAYSDPINADIIQKLKYKPQA